MLYPLSYSRAAGQCIKGAGTGIRAVSGSWLAKGYEIAQFSGM